MCTFNKWNTNRYENKTKKERKQVENLSASD